MNFETIMPNGKPFGQCTKADLMEFARVERLLAEIPAQLQAYIDAPNDVFVDATTATVAQWKIAARLESNRTFTTMLRIAAALGIKDDTPLLPYLLELRSKFPDTGSFTRPAAVRRLPGKRNPLEKAATIAAQQNTAARILTMRKTSSRKLNGSGMSRIDSANGAGSTKET